MRDREQPSLIPRAPAPYAGRFYCDRCLLADRPCYLVDDAKALRWCASCCDAAGIERARPRTAADLELDDGRPRRAR